MSEVSLKCILFHTPKNLFCWCQNEKKLPIRKLTITNDNFRLIRRRQRRNLTLERIGMKYRHFSTSKSPKKLKFYANFRVCILTDTVQKELLYSAWQIHPICQVKYNVVWQWCQVDLLNRTQQNVPKQSRHRTFCCEKSSKQFFEKSNQKLLK